LAQILTQIKESIKEQKSETAKIHAIESQLAELRDLKSERDRLRNLEIQAADLRGQFNNQTQNLRDTISQLFNQIANATRQNQNNANLAKIWDEAAARIRK
jgi:phage host-nuclease inhibitor protein Gam